MTTTPDRGTGTAGVLAHGSRWAHQVDALVRTLPPQIEIIRAMRPHQWVKNLVVYAALVFSAREAWFLSDPETWLPLLARTTVAFAVFCAVSSGQYLVNDVIDAPSDREHPNKRMRPIAAGRVSPRLALTVATLLTVGGMAGAIALGLEFALLVAAYIALTIAYSTALKHLVIIDVLVIASGFAIRAIGGAAAISVEPTPWMWVITFAGALFLAIAKRHQEFRLIESRGATRKSLGEYTPELLDQMNSVALALLVVPYVLYAATATNVPANHSMLATVPVMLYGLFRYHHVARLHPERGPEETFLRDRPLLLSVIAFGVVALLVLLVWRDTSWTVAS